MLRIRQARLDDAGALADRLREADIQEIRANLGEDPLAVLKRSIVISVPCYTAADRQDSPVAVFGVAPDTHNRDIGMVWLLGSVELVNHQVFVLRQSRKWVEELQRHYKVLWNCVDARNEVHIRWLKWCGFVFIRLIEEYGVERRPFFEFEKVRYDDQMKRGAREK
jgi:hypothetical protein